MSISVRINKTAIRRRITKAQKKALKDVKRVLDKEIVKTIESGSSPVKGKGRFKKYSDSYKDQIRGKAEFFKDKQGRTRRIEVDQKDREVVSFLKAKFGNKKISPVNLKLSGKLLKSYFSKLRGFKNQLIIGFDNELADIHNNKGAGKSKVVRRMLPNDGERFNARINRKIKNALAKTFPKAFNRG